MASARKIIIIGATSGIGYEITQLYRKQGWRIGIDGIARKNPVGST